MPTLNRRGMKYGNTTSIYNGRSYHSKKEAGYARLLDMMRKASKPSERVVEWEGQYAVTVYLDGPRLTLTPTQHRAFRIIPDFFITFDDGHQEIHEVKGYETAEWRFKWRLFEAVWDVEHPDIQLVVIR